jgi:8-oxo-dGTP pyrophosphatase MutT (NUDIX family)
VATKWIVSVKGIVRVADTVLLARNDRDEWELPGGQLERDETLEQCVAREIMEESGLSVTVGRHIRSWVSEVVPGAQVLLVAYECALDSPYAEITRSDEHTDVTFLPLTGLDQIPLPEGYRTAIRLA